MGAHDGAITLVAVFFWFFWRLLVRGILLVVHGYDWGGGGETRLYLLSALSPPACVMNRLVYKTSLFNSIAHINIPRF